MTGSGMTAVSRDRLLRAGVDLLTLGFHHWDAPDAAEVNAHPSVLVPHNSSNFSGGGCSTMQAAGETLSVAVIATDQAMPETEVDDVDVRGLVEEHSNGRM
jgi:calcineurin-like phosphoesterase